jgi:hypothetical protein
MTCYLQPEKPGKLAPLCKQDTGFPLYSPRTAGVSLAPRSQHLAKQAPELLLSAGLDPLCLQRYCTALLKPMPQQAGPRTTTAWRFGSPMPAAATWLLVACWQAGLRALAAHRLYSLMTAAAPVAPGSWHLVNVSQNSHCLQAWIPHACSSCHDSW